MTQRFTRKELEESWTLGPDEYAPLSGKRGTTRLGFAIMLRFFAQCGRFPAPEEINEDAVEYVASQVDVAAARYRTYDHHGRSAEYHRAQIREAFGFRQATVEDTEELAEWLLEEVAPREYDVERLMEAAYARLRIMKVEPPTSGRVERVVRSALRSYDDRFCQTTLERLSGSAIAEMDTLLSEPGVAEDGAGGYEEGREEPTLARLRSDPGRAGVEGARAELSKLSRLRELGLPEDLFQDTAPRVVRAYRRRAASESPSSLRAHPPAVRYTLLAALCFMRLREVTDGLVEVLLQIVHNIGARSERKVEKILLEDFKKVSGKNSLLFRVAEAALAEPDGLVRDVVFPVVDERTLGTLVKEAKATGAAYQVQVQLKMRASYVGYYRQVIPAVLGSLEFRSNNAAHRPVVRALALIKAYAGSPRRFYDEDEDIPLEVIPAGWHELVFNNEGAESARNGNGSTRADRVAYELCTLDALRDGLRSKEVWVVGANRYRNPDEDLPQDFDEHREHYYEALGQPMEADKFVEGLQTEMEVALQSLDKDVPHNPHLRIREKGNARISLSKLPPQTEPPNLDDLKADIVRRWPMTGLLDILKETDLRLDFSQHFTTVASRQILDPDTLRKRLLLCLYGLGTNTGLKRVAAGDPESGYSDLRYVRRRFVHKEQLRAAIACVVNGIFDARSAEIYARVSTDRQEKEQTIESQLDLLHRAAEEDGYEVAPSHVFIDERRSGSHLDRPGLDRLRDLASEGTFEAVLIASPDRLARNYAYQVIVFEELQRAGCEVVFLNHSFGETPEERMLLQMQGVFAEYERALIKERTRRGRLFAARQGRVNWSHAPYGYRLIRKTESVLQKLVIDETEAEVVRQIFRWCVEERMTCYATEKRLRHMEAPTREGSPLGWWQSTVGDILRNTSYKARRRRSCHEGQAQSFYWQYFATKYRRKFRIRLETALSLLRSGETESACVSHGSIAVPCSFSNDVFGTFRFIFSQILAPYDSLTVTGPTWQTPGRSSRWAPSPCPPTSHCPCSLHLHGSPEPGLPPDRR